MTLLDLRAEAEKRQPWWFTLIPAAPATSDNAGRPAVRLRFKPIDRLVVRAGRRAGHEIYRIAALEEGETPPQELIEAASDAMSEAMIAAGIIEWEGVGDGAGEIAPLTPDFIALLLADPGRFERCEAEYVRPWLVAEAEKNASSLSLNGISAGAENDIADSSAKRTATGAARKMKRKG
jgi:hypothetical protein